MVETTRRAGLLLASCALAAGCRLIDAAGAEERAARQADAAAADAGCASVPLVTDDFEDEITGAGWQPYNDPGAEVVEADGVLRVTYSAEATAWAGYATSASHDLRGGWLAAEVSQVGGETILELKSGATKVQMFAWGATMYGNIIVADDTTSQFQTDYLPVEHRHWRMREQEGRIHWEASPDGAAWSELYAKRTGIALDAVTFLVSGGGVAGDAAAEFEAVSIRVADPACR